MLQITCTCGYTAKVPEGYAGQKLRCPKCTNLMDSSAPAAPPPPAPPAEPAPVEVPRVMAGGGSCAKCSRPMAADQLLCLHCGHRAAETTQAKFERRALLQHGQDVNEVSELGRKSLIWSLVGMFCLPLLPSAFGAYFGFQSLKRSKENELPANGMAVGGLVIAGLSFFGWLVYGVIVIVGIGLAQKANEHMGERFFDNLPPIRSVPPPNTPPNFPQFDPRFDD